jgi:hypothetical protein
MTYVMKKVSLYVAYEFNSKGNFLGTKFLTLREAQSTDSGKQQNFHCKHVQSSSFSLLLG